jgi:DNA-binding CsgD family transcriptional regulator
MADSFQLCGSTVQRFPELSHFQPAHTLSATCDALWWGLTHGQLCVVESEIDDQYAALRIRPRIAGTPGALRAHAVEAFERVLLGCAQKVVASELSIPNASLSAMLKEIAYGMGFRCCVSRIPLAVPLLLHALKRRGLHGLWLAPSPSFENEIQVRVRRLDAVLGAGLSRGERDVAWYFLEGRSYVEIANRRRVSVRTVANQVGSVFRKVGASGRFDLLRAAVDRVGNRVAVPRSTYDSGVDATP